MVIAQLPPAPSGPRRSPVVRRLLAGAVAAGAVLGGVLVLLPADRAKPPPPAPGPMARTVRAVGAGVPVGLPDLAALIGEREARVRTRPGDGRSWALLGAAYVEQGRRTAAPAFYPKAETALRTALGTGAAGKGTAVEGLAALANARGDFRAARKWGEEAVARAPKRWTAYPQLLEAYEGLGDHKAVRRTLDRLQELRSGPAVMARAAQVYRDRGWREDAAAALADAAAGARTPAERAAYLSRAGDLAWERGEPEEALLRYGAALRTDPDEYTALAGQGRALTSLHRASEALQAYRTVLERRPSPRYALELGELYESLGLGGAARVQYDLLRERAREEAAGGVDVELVLGLFEADHGDARSAVRRLRGEWERHPGVAVADALGWALHRAGQDEEALKFATRAMDAEHGGGVRSALYAYHRGEIERSLKRYGPARRHLQEALRVNPYFSPLLVPAAEEALKALGEPAAVGPPEESEGAEDTESSEDAAEPGPEPSAARPTDRGGVSPAPVRSGSR
ncbi:tetratricopeptide repeat protein [Streptomyces sp. NPDC086783]|uniref:tetratricopeptide repeat protein n=1 Tax=Streptomyces sp. NPDC086783 TaxID=3365758 RepID=UPI00380842FA